MSTNFDCVVTYHQNIHTCGVARFNHYLAEFLQVPMMDFDELGNRACSFPLISIKESEMIQSDIAYLSTVIKSKKFRYSLILHSFVGSETEIEVLQSAERVMALNAQMASQISIYRPDVITGFTVPTPLLKDSDSTNYKIRLITFGMAHKIRSSGYKKVADLLKIDGLSSILEISSALHEGTEFDDQFFNVGREISEVFDGHVEFLGFLADYEVARRVQSADVMLAFFPEGARENNNSVLSAMSMGTPVITNLDAWSPSWLKHNESVFDINQMSEFPSKPTLKRVGNAARYAVAPYTFMTLTSLLTDVIEQ